MSKNWRALARVFDEVGVDVLKAPDADEVLEAYGVVRSELTDRDVDKALELTQQKVSGEIPSRSLLSGTDDNGRTTGRKSDAPTGRREVGGAPGGKREGSPVRVSESDARVLLGDLGLKTAADPKKCSVSKLQERLNRLPELAEGEAELPEGKSRSIQQLVTEALAQKETVVVIPDKATKETAMENSSNGKAKAKSEKVKRGPVVTSVGDPKPAKKNEFGSLLGKDLAAADACLTTEPKTVNQIVDEIKFTGQFRGKFYNHFNELVSRGLIVKTDDGYALKGSKKTSPGKSAGKKPSGKKREAVTA